jgi:hypothetical protein
VACPLYKDAGESPKRRLHTGIILPAYPAIGQMKMAHLGLKQLICG